jgi:hypothetical protein
MGDAVSACSGEILSLAIEGAEGAALGAEPDNLVLRAARALAQAAGFEGQALLHLLKRLPVASGIGGGSADAAASLRALNRLWDLGWPEARLAALGAKLGADVPVCVGSRPARALGCCWRIRVRLWRRQRYFARVRAGFRRGLNCPKPGEMRLPWPRIWLVWGMICRHPRSAFAPRLLRFWQPSRQAPAAFWRA